MTTFVLVHGAYHGGWCWQGFAPLLEAEGHTVLSPTLTGLGNRFDEATKDVGISTHIADILALYETQGLTDTVLVGHSYGGVIVGGVADVIPDKVSTLIFLDAVLPEDGLSMLDKQSAKHSENLINAAKNHNGWQIPVPPVTFFGLLEPEHQRLGIENCVPQPLKCFSEKSTITGAYLSVPRTAYIRCISPPMSIMDEYQKTAEQQPGWDVYEMATGHDCMISDPQGLADILLKYAN